MTRATAMACFTRWFACAAAIASFAVHAQAQPQDYDTDTDPPVRVARMSYTSGRVSFSPAGSDAWVEARVNRPVVTGDRVWSDADSRAELALDNGTWWLGDSTSLAVSNLDDRIVQVQLQEGTLEVRLRRLPPDNIVEIDTPNLAFSLTRPGRYRVEVDPQDGSTLVIVRDGSGDVYGEGGSYVVTAGQAYRFYGTDVSDSEFVELPPRDAFDRFAADRDRLYASSASLRYVSPEVIGYEDLDRYGSWSVEATYGDVWFPRAVSVDWAPYREGHWAWIDPWGWTWVDNEPWGFAPFHYGRWAHFSRGWGWVPGPRSVRAVYAPALVAFVGGAGFGIAVSSGPAIGWFPLAPREVYVPPYRVSRNYFRQVNVTNTVVNVTNITNIYNNPARISEIRYANRTAPNAVTAVPPAAFAQAQNVARAAVPVPAAAVQRAEVRPVAPVAPARPAFLGASPAAQVRPPAATMQRPVLARTPPPPPPVPDTQKIQALEKNPGRPLSRTEVQTLRRAAPPAAAAAPALAPAPAKVVTQAKPAPNAAPPARQAGARPPGQAPGGTQRRAGPGAPPEAAPRGPAPAEPPRGPAAAQPAAPAMPSLRPQPPAAERGLPQETPARRPPPPAGARPPEGNAPTPPSGLREAPARPPEARPAPQLPEAARRSEPPRGPPSEAARPAPQPQLRPVPTPQPQLRPVPTPQPQARPAPPPQPEGARRPEPPAEAVRPAPQPQLRPAPTPQPQARPAAPPQPQARPAPPPQPEAARRPEPPRGPPAEAARPAPQPQLRPAPPPQPQARPGPPPQQVQPTPPRPEGHPPAQQQPQPQRRQEKDEKGGGNG